jgi:hypothetical protein
LLACRAEADISFFTRLLFAAYFLEAGLILVIAPWTNFWSGNLFIASYPDLQGLLGSPFLRGAVSGVGAITTLAGLAELASAVVARHRPDVPQPNKMPESP